MKTNVIKAIAVLLIGQWFLACDTTKTEPIAQVKINTSEAPAKRWEDALISGNGEMGIMVHGNPKKEKIILNHELLYEYIGTESIKPPEIADIASKAKQLIKATKYREAKNEIQKHAKEKGLDGILWTDPYHPACALDLHQEFQGEVLNYERSQNYENGEITVHWNAEDTQYSRTSFVSRTDNIIATKIESDKESNINISLELTKLFTPKKVKDLEKISAIEENVKMLFPDKWENLNTPFIEETENKAEGHWLTLRRKYQLADRGYEVIINVKNQGGVVSNKDNKIFVKEADKVEVFTKVIPIEPFSESAITFEKKAINNLPSYDVLMKKHAPIHAEMFNRVTLNLDKTGFADGTNETLIAEQKEKGKINPYLLEKVFNMGIYGLISSSGKNPPNLMGIWNGQWRPSWSGDFTLDANINLQISAANLANQKEAMDSYMNLLERIAPDWEVNAKNLYGCRGYLSGVRTSGRHNYQTHFGNWPGNYWTAGAPWLLFPCYEYYLCTGDKDFMLNRLYPMLKKTALFYEDFLDTYDDNGKFFIAPSYSPENGAVLPDGSRYDAVANASMDIAVIRELLNSLIFINNELNLKEEKIALWKDMLAKLPPYLINEDGAIKEWSLPNLGDNYDHKHVSHLYSVWPGLEIAPEKEELFAAANMAIEKRGKGNGSAHGLAHTGLIAARLKKADLVYNNVLYILKNNYLYSSLVTSHNPNAIYNTDALLSVPAVILEMLVYSRPGVIEFLPALSEKFPKGNVSGVLCRTQAKIETLNWDMVGKSMMAKVSSGKKQAITFQLRKAITEIEVNDAKTNFEGGTFTVNFESGESKTIKILW